MWANWNLRQNYQLDNPDRKGSLTLRSNYKKYSRPVLVCNWYQHREAEPKDYDMDTIPEGYWKNLHRSTYRRFISVPPGDWSTTSEAFMSQISFKDDYRLREKMPLMDQKTAAKELRKRYAETTYNYDFMPPLNFIPAPDEVPKEPVDYRRCHSQFVDTDDYRRHGRNTWMNESGIYANSELRKVLFPPSNPIATRLK
ncbi:cilia- and flagella-associated protein 95-like [Hemiscyllium ocellatum]|uniref:cilia- and flagella-associated protein 95-like n=1 Tax=Hemiscyllium ocellatum TaxID=170820 RepID=UPI002967461C|nr:cilia- and flagella-associated protein 95-like [Hemiscyllium ocellatum]